MTLADELMELQNCDAGGEGGFNPGIEDVDDAGLAFDEHDGAESGEYDNAY